jgi:hypothetical protein
MAQAIGDRAMDSIAELNRSVSLDSAATYYTKHVKTMLAASLIARKTGFRNDALALATPRNASSRLQAMLKASPQDIDEFKKQITLPPTLDAHDRLLNQFVQKSAVAVGGIDTGTWGSAIAPLLESSAGFLQSLSPFSSFDKILNDGGFTRARMHSRVVVSSAAAVAEVVDEGSPKPLGAMAFSSETMRAFKAIAQVIVSDELALSMLPGSTSRIQADLGKAVAKACDEKFLEIVSQGTGVASSPSTGLSAGAFLGDVHTAAQSITFDDTRRLYLVLPVSVFVTVSLLRDGGPLVINGKLGSINIIPTSAQIADGVLLDSSAVAADGGVAITEVSNESDIELEDNPTAGSHRLVSLWQNDLQLTRTERWFGACVLRSDGIAVISNMTTA